MRKALHKSGNKRIHAFFIQKAESEYVYLPVEHKTSPQSLLYYIFHTPSDIKNHFTFSTNHKDLR